MLFTSPLRSIVATPTNEVWSIMGTAVLQHDDLDPLCMYCDGSAGGYAETPDSTALGNLRNGDFTATICVTLSDYTAAAQQHLAGQYGSAANHSWLFYLNATTGAPMLWTTADGTNVAKNFTVANPGFVDGTTYILQAKFKYNDGGVSSVEFYWATLGSTLALIGTKQAHTGLISLYNSTADLGVGASSGGNNPVTGKVYWMEIHDGTASVVFFNPRQAALSQTARMSDPEDAIIPTVVRDTRPMKPVSTIVLHGIEEGLGWYTGQEEVANEGMLLGWKNRSDEAALVANYELASMPVEHLQNEHIAIKWGTPSGVTFGVLLIAYQDSVTLNMLALIGANLTSSAQIMLRASDTDPNVLSDLVLDTGWQDARAIEGYGNVVLYHGDVTARYWQCYLSDAEATGGLRAGRLLQMQAWRPSVNQLYGWGVGVTDSSKIGESHGGQYYPDPKQPRRVLQCTLTWMDEEEMYSNAFAMAYEKGLSGDVFMCPNLGSPKRAQQSVWGPLAGIDQLTNDAHGIYKTRIAVKERL